MNATRSALYAVLSIPFAILLMPSLISSAMAQGTCAGFGKITEIENYGSQIQECEKTYLASAENGETLSPAQKCLRRVDPSGDLEAMVYRLACEDFCQKDDSLLDRTACYIVKANARKARALANGVPLDTIDREKKKALAVFGDDKLEYWKHYSQALKALATPPAAPLSASKSEPIKPTVAKRVAVTPAKGPAQPRVERDQNGVPLLSFPHGCQDVELPTTYLDNNGEPKSCVPQKRKVHLTFDDGPAGSETSALIDTLDRLDLDATFFVLANRINSNIGVIQKARKQGHRIACHSLDHADHSKLTLPQVQIHADACVNTGYDQLGPFMSAIYRLPKGAGVRNPHVKAAYKEAGFRESHVGWHADSKDYQNKTDPIASMKNVLNDLCRYGGGLVLFHDIHKTTTRNVAAFVEAIQCAGYEFGSLEEAMGEKVPLITPKGRKPDPLSDCPVVEKPSQAVEDLKPTMDRVSVEDLFE